MPNLKTFATLAALATFSLAVPILPLLANPFGTIVPAPLGADKDGEHPTVVVDTHKVLSGGKECKVWHLGQDGANITPECRQWVTDADDSTSNHVIVEIQTVKLADENAVCEKWHVESHENLITPICGEIKQEPGFGPSDVEDVGVLITHLQPKRDESDVSSEVVHARSITEDLLHLVKGTKQAGMDIADETIDIARGAVGAMLPDHSDKSKRSEEGSKIKPAKIIHDLVETVKPLQPLPSLEEVQNMVAHIKDKNPGLVHFLVRLAHSDILKEKLWKQDPKMTLALDGIAEWVGDTADTMKAAQIAREQNDDGMIAMTEPALRMLIGLEKKGDEDGDERVYKEFASVEAADDVIRKAEEKVRDEAMKDKVQHLQDDGHFGVFPPVGTLNADKAAVIAGRDVAATATTSAKAATAQRAIDAILYLRARKAVDGPDVAVSLEVDTRPAAERLADLVAKLEPLPYLGEILPMTASINKMVPGAAVILARVKDSPILQQIKTQPEKTVVREVTALGSLFADPHAFLETAKQARASIAAGNLTITEPTFANLLSGYHNLTNRATLDDLPRVITNATYAAEVMTELEEDVAAHGANDSDHHDDRLQRRVLPLGVLYATFIVPSLLGAMVGGIIKSVG
ncbi:hypothetical protein LTR78_001755 [Recurvomyces mirabilis]|uniref:Secreted protein n=1 Tax=Recurvomyces mirabilis TaxID=574656 RepID=A0AAE0WV74_9PEZI|nr:hypothetical protein LTR78_001755 [Recurvomyces mirabilis]KAK5150170.1 hypothetical protein LTS14_010299 [Recurvomyces mirabilis]